MISAWVAVTLFITVQLTKHPETRGGISQTPVKFLEIFGGPERTRTFIPLFRRQMPYPIGPRVHLKNNLNNKCKDICSSSMVEIYFYFRHMNNIGLYKHP